VDRCTKATRVLTWVWAPFKGFCRFRNQADRQVRRVREQAAPNAPILPPADRVIQDEVRDGLVARRRIDHLLDSAGIRKEVALNQHRVAQLAPDLTAARSPITCGDVPSAARAAGLDH